MTVFGSTHVMLERIPSLQFSSLNLPDATGPVLLNAGRLGHGVEQAELPRRAPFS
jgi:hypothetical protein